MGIYGALATAVSGLRAQSFALEAISGNIANSQTTGYKRIETGFVDLIPEAPLKAQIPGAVIAQSRATNSDGGDIISASTDTYMALNGSGFFVVEQKIGQNDGGAVFGGADYYTRRGDFDVDKQGYLVNGAGYYLKGLDIDPDTGNISGSVPQVIRLSNAFLPAEASTRLDYQLNLPQVPKTTSSDPSTPNSELLDPAEYNSGNILTPVTVTGATGLVGTDNAATVMAAGESMTITVDGVDHVFDFYDGNAGAYAGGNIGIDVQTAAAVDIDAALAAMTAALPPTSTVSLVGGTVTLTDTDSKIAIVDETSGLSLANGTYWPEYDIGSIEAGESDNFLANSVAGGAITVYAENGTPVNVQLRWAKISNPGVNGTDRWNLFYLQDSMATGTDPMWVNAGVDYDFNAAGSLVNSIPNLTINNMSVNGVDLGDIEIQHGTGGVTQFANANGTAKVTALSQNGYPPGEFISVTINEAGRVVASYTNGEQVEIAQVVVAQFNAANSLKRLDGGVFAATSESGEAILDTSGGILGSSLESSNTDISEEFTKLIVTQQAYAAGTRIVSTSDEMLQEVLNMIR